MPPACPKEALKCVTVNMDSLLEAAAASQPDSTSEAAEALKGADTVFCTLGTTRKVGGWRVCVPGEVWYYGTCGCPGRGMMRGGVPRPLPCPVLPAYLSVSGGHCVLPVCH